MMFYGCYFFFAIARQFIPFSKKNSISFHLPLRTSFCFLSVFHNQHTSASSRNNMDNEPKMHRTLHEPPQYHSGKHLNFVLLLFSFGFIKIRAYIVDRSQRYLKSTNIISNCLVFNYLLFNIL